MLVHLVVSADTTDRFCRATIDINGEERWHCATEISRDHLRLLLDFVEKALDPTNPNAVHSDFDDAE